jgi:RNA polymerase sigma factor (sigma-70 family)
MQGDDPTLTDLVKAAAAGDASSWDSIVARFSPLVLSVTARYRLADADVADVSQTLWLRLVQNLRGLREPQALPGWIVTTTRNECLRVLNFRQRLTTYDPLTESPGDRGDYRHVTQIDLAEDLLRAERHEALLLAFAELSDRDRELLLLLLADPPMSYAQISESLGMPVGAIGPTRARALERLRRSPALAALRNADDATDNLTGSRRG